MLRSTASLRSAPAARRSHLLLRGRTIAQAQPGSSSEHPSDWIAGLLHLLFMFDNLRLIIFLLFNKVFSRPSLEST